MKQKKGMLSDCSTVILFQISPKYACCKGNQQRPANAEAGHADKCTKAFPGYSWVSHNVIVTSP